MPITTLAVGEEDPAKGSKGVTTLRLGEETGDVAVTVTTPAAGGESGPVTTMRVGEETPTTKRRGEEGPTTLKKGEEGPHTTLALGEEEPDVTTKRVGEEDLTTLVVGEEDGPMPGRKKGNPFGHFPSGRRVAHAGSKLGSP